MLNKIVQALETPADDSCHKARFYSENKLSGKDFLVRVKGVGEIEGPISDSSIQKLLEISFPAKFGKRDKTLLDKNVRDTCEITANKLEISYDEKKFTDLLDTVCQDLGLPSQAKLSAHLQNMLIYGPGQFFKSHQDSEKLEGMVASLIIVLPSAHIGGHLIIRHGKKTTPLSQKILNQKIYAALHFIRIVLMKFKK